MNMLQSKPSVGGLVHQSSRPGKAVAVLLQAASKPRAVGPSSTAPQAVAPKVLKTSLLQHRTSSVCAAVASASEAVTAGEEAHTLTFLVTHPSLPHNHTLHIVGGIEEVGNWKPEDGVHLKHVSGQLWQGQCVLPSRVEGTVPFKLVIMQPGAAPVWEKGDNRKLTLPLPDPPADHSSAASWHLLLHWDMLAVNRLVHEATFTVGGEPGAEEGDMQPVPTDMEAHCMLHVPNASLADGQTLLIVGSAPELGAWDAEKAVVMERVDSTGCWMAGVTLPVGTSAEVKLVTRDASGKLHWESGPNRRLSVVDPAINPSISSKATGATAYITLLPDSHAVAPPPILFPTLPDTAAAASASRRGAGSKGKAAAAPKKEAKGAAADEQQARGASSGRVAAAAASEPQHHEQQDAAWSPSADAPVADHAEEHGEEEQGQEQPGLRLLNALLGSVSGSTSSAELLDAVQAAAKEGKQQEAVSTITQLERQLALVKAQLTELGVPGVPQKPISKAPPVDAAPKSSATKSQSKAPAKPAPPPPPQQQQQQPKAAAPASANGTGHVILSDEAAEPDVRKPAPAQQSVGLRPSHGAQRKQHSPSPNRPIGPPPSDMEPFESQVMGILAMYPNKRLPELQAMLSASTLEPRYNHSLEKLSALINYMVAAGTITSNGFGQYCLRDINIEVPAARRRSPSPRQRPRGETNGFSANGFDLNEIMDDLTQANKAAMGSTAAGTRPPTPSPTRPSTPTPSRPGTPQPSTAAPQSTTAAGKARRGRPRRDTSADSTATPDVSDAAAARPSTPRPTRARKAGKSVEASDADTTPAADAAGSKAKRRTWGGRGTTKSNSPDSVGVGAGAAPSMMMTSRL